MENSIVNILLVDDRKENLLALEAVLSSSNYNLIKANSGEEALKWILMEDFAVILMDVQMPGLDGFETARLIREREKSKDIPIIFITALSQKQENILQGYSVGAIDYIIKPFDPIILKCKVDGFVSMYLNQMEIQVQKEIINERTKELQEAFLQLKRNEILSRALGETSIDTFVVLNSQGNILLVNPAVTEMFGYSIKEIMGKHINLLLTELSLQNLSCVPKGELIETNAQRRDGTKFPVDIQLTVAEIESGSIFVCSIRDITERKNQFNMLEELVKERTLELCESEEKYRLLVEESPEGIIVRKMKSNQWSFINKTGLNILKAKNIQDFSHKSFNDLIYPDDRELLNKNIEKVREGKIIDGFELKFIRVDGEVIDVEVKIIPFMYEGEQSLHVMFRDITVFKQTREFMHQSEKLTVVGELAAGIAHEIRNPLTSLRGFTQLLQFDLGANHEYVDIMINEIDRINTIVSELLLLAKPNKFEFKQVLLQKLLDDMITLMNGQANLHGVEIQLILESSIEDCYIYGIENKIKQVLINIVKNAIEAMPDGGLLIIKVGFDQDQVVLHFIDHGYGIPSEVLENIGQPFYTTKEKGTGLGLMVCYSIIESHQGILSIDSQEGKGTVVQIKLPCARNRVEVLK
ncbi:PAS domain S-box protein [Bacillus massilinigeriensis]|uniref:PAS domain S-box protein n=1 Tax=Bacillus massilionigeriensis TaxID=1805475 RepID=UPI00096AE893|nr:PAS domain S-box protein [Bacillus massilionigeriensis]